MWAVVESAPRWAEVQMERALDIPNRWDWGYPEFIVLEEVKAINSTDNRRYMFIDDEGRTVVCTL